MDVPICSLHGQVYCSHCGRAALARSLEATTPIFRNGVRVGNLSDFKTGKIMKGAVKK